MSDKKPSILNNIAVSSQKGENAAEILTAYVQTGPSMQLSHTHAPTPASPSHGAAPKGTKPTGAVDPLG